MAQPPRADTNQVHEACLEFLNMELVDYVLRTSEKSSETIYTKLERMGFRVGQRLAEKYTKDRPRFQELLEIIKFVCKEYWTEIFRKQIDNLKTNHRGVYVLQDNKFKFLLHLSPNTPKETAQNYLLFPCGLVRGALANLGVPCIVTAEISSLPACTFTIKMIKQ